MRRTHETGPPEDSPGVIGRTPTGGAYRRSEHRTADDLVEVRPLEAEDLRLVAGWLADERNARWLDFGPGVETMSPALLRVITQRGHHRLWVFGPADTPTPVGVVGLGSIQPDHRTAELWYVLGDKTHARRGLTSAAVLRVLGHAFDELALHCVYAWTVDANVGSRRILEKAGFLSSGRIRDRHRIEGDARDRLWFDLLADEFRGAIGRDAS